MSEEQFVFDENLDKVERGLESLKEAGVSFDDIATHFLDLDKPEKAEIAQVKKRFNDFIKTQQVEKVKQEQAQVEKSASEWKQSLKSLVDSDEENFDFIRATNATMDEIFNFGKEEFLKNPEDKDLMDREKLLQRYENFLVEKYKPLLTNKKAKKVIQPEPEEVLTPIEKAKRLYEGKTITEKIMDNTDSKVPETKKLSKSERFEAAKRFWESKG